MRCVTLFLGRVGDVHGLPSSACTIVSVQHVREGGPFTRNSFCVETLEGVGCLSRGVQQGVHATPCRKWGAADSGVIAFKHVAQKCLGAGPPGHPPVALGLWAWPPRPSGGVADL